MSSFFSRLCALVVLAGLALPAAAQQPTRVNPTESSVHEQQLLDALKSGGPASVSGRITIPDSRAGSLIQPGGRSWEEWRNTTLPRIGLVPVSYTHLTLPTNREV